MASITQDSRIVEVFSANMGKKNVDKKELNDAYEWIKELANHPNPNNRYEIAQILRFVINDGLVNRVRYIEDIADVKHTGKNEKAQFQIEIDDLKAMFQAKSSTTERSKISNKHFFLDTEEVSIRPAVNYLDLASGKADFVQIASKSVNRLELAIVKRIQDSIYDAFSGMSSPNYAGGAGIVQSDFDPILFAMQRAGGSASIMGDVEALAQFTDLSGFNDRVPDELAVEHNQNGMIGGYKGSNLMRMNNPFKTNSVTETELRKDLIYAIPTGDVNLRPVKVQFEGSLQVMEDTNINGKEYEMRFDQYVGVGVIGVRKLLGVYEDTAL